MWKIMYLCFFLGCGECMTVLGGNKNGKKEDFNQILAEFSKQDRDKKKEQEERRAQNPERVAIIKELRLAGILLKGDKIVKNSDTPEKEKKLASHNEKNIDKILCYSSDQYSNFLKEALCMVEQLSQQVALTSDLLYSKKKLSKEAQKIFQQAIDIFKNDHKEGEKILFLLKEAYNNSFAKCLKKLCSKEFSEDSIRFYYAQHQLFNLHKEGNALVDKIEYINDQMGTKNELTIFVDGVLDGRGIAGSIMSMRQSLDTVIKETENKRVCSADIMTRLSKFIESYAEMEEKLYDDNKINQFYLDRYQNFFSLLKQDIKKSLTYFEKKKEEGKRENSRCSQQKKRKKTSSKKNNYFVKQVEQSYKSSRAKNQSNSQKVVSKVFQKNSDDVVKKVEQDFKGRLKKHLDFDNNFYNDLGIKEILNRVSEWSSDNPKERFEKFCDYYYKDSPEKVNNEKFYKEMVCKHAFPKPVWQVLAQEGIQHTFCNDQDGEEVKSYNLVAECTIPGVSKKSDFGVLSCGVNEGGICYHMAFSRNKLPEIAEKIHAVQYNGDFPYALGSKRVTEVETIDDVRIEKTPWDIQFSYKVNLGSEGKQPVCLSVYKNVNESRREQLSSYK